MACKIQLLLLLLNTFIVGDLPGHKNNGFGLLCNHCRSYFEEERFRIIKLPYDALPRSN